MAGKEGKGKEDKDPSQLSETIDLLKRYVLQETVGPLRGIGRILVFGLLGGLLLAIGLVILDIAVLRALQTETGHTFAGHWSWAPYLLALAAALLAVVLVIMVAVRGGSKGKAK